MFRDHEMDEPVEVFNNTKVMESIVGKDVDVDHNDRECGDTVDLSTKVGTVTNATSAAAKRKNHARGARNVAVNIG